MYHISKSKRSLKRSRDRDAKIAIGSEIFFSHGDRDRDRNLTF